MLSDSKLIQLFEKIELLDQQDLSALQNFISDSIERVTRRPVKRLESYHLTHSDCHDLMKKKSSREFNASEVSKILCLPSFKKLMARFSEFSIDSVINERGIEHRPEIYFRLVRPNKPDDVGFPHMDNWHHRAANLCHRPGTTFKVWVSIVSDSSKNGLLFFPDASVSDIIWSINRGKLFCDPTQLAFGAPYLPDVMPGEAFIFRDDVLHSGAVNAAQNTRVSVEITLVRKSRSS